MAGEYASARLYVMGVLGQSTFALFTPGEWRTVSQSQRGKELTITVRALNSAAPDTVGESVPRTVHLTNDDIKGGVYYWASEGTLPGGVYRHDMGNPGQLAEPFYTTGESPEERCVACHVLSRDGTKMAVTYDGGNGASSIVDVATQTTSLPTDGSDGWNFASFEPGSTRILTVESGVINLRDAQSGAIVSTPEIEGYASHVDFAPGADAIVYVAGGAPKMVSTGPVPSTTPASSAMSSANDTFS